MKIDALRVLFAIVAGLIVGSLVFLFARLWLVSVSLGVMVALLVLAIASIERGQKGRKTTRRTRQQLRTKMNCCLYLIEAGQSTQEKIAACEEYLSYYEDYEAGNDDSIRAEHDSVMTTLDQLKES